MASYCLAQLGLEISSYATEQGERLLNVPIASDYNVIMSIQEVIELAKEEQIILLLALNKWKYKETIRLLHDSGIGTVYTIWTLLDSVNFLESSYDNAIKERYMYRNKVFIYQEFVNCPGGSYCESVDVMVTEKCSLKCESCSNLMQYYEEPQHLELLSVKEDIDIFLQKIDRLGELRFLGGEPFMRCEFVNLIDEYLDNPKIWQISVFTNATIFPDEATLEHLKHKKIFMRMSNYGKLSRNLDRWIAWCEANEVAYIVVPIDVWQDCGKLKKHNYSEGKLRAVYNTCECRSIPTLLKGRLYNV